MSELKLVKKAAITADGWTSFSQDHYLTVTLHWVRDGQNKEKVLKTKAVYQAQTGPAVAEEIDGILEEFEVRQKVVAATVDNAANMRVAVNTLHMTKLPCFAHTLNLGAQKLYNCNTISNWVARIRSVVVWMKRSHMAKVILKEKQDSEAAADEVSEFDNPFDCSTFLLWDISLWLCGSYMVNFFSSCQSKERHRGRGMKRRKKMTM